jgi:glycosyltransferase involved in cell wall biosynthesis
MNIGFDAKRAFHNATGLGNYSRTLIRLLAGRFAEHHYYLFNPKSNNHFSVEGKNITEVLPTSFIDKLFSSAWRSRNVKKDLKRLSIDLYHGLSHEIPVGIDKTGIRSIVTIHDLIHERYPEHYNPIDVRIYRKKFRYACEHANRVIAISAQTKSDIIQYYGTNPDKITVCYNTVDPAYRRNVSEDEKVQLRSRLQLPNEFFLYVGSITERKNLLSIVKALNLLRDELKIPLVIIGDGTKYKQQVKDFANQHALEKQLIFLSEKNEVKNDGSFHTPENLNKIYRSASILVYPSLFEGFGLPVLEALSAGLPVITSNNSSLPEVGGTAAYYVDPLRAADIAEGIKKIYADKEFGAELAAKGKQQAEKFSQDKYVTQMMQIYQSL